MINELAKQVHANARSKGFFDTEKNIGEMLCLIHSEVSECLEADRKHHFAVKHSNLNDAELFDVENLTQSERLYFQQEFETHVKNSFEDELADVMIRCMDLAAFKNIDLEYHIKMKMMYNRLREHKHGKKY